MTLDEIREVLRAAGLERVADAAERLTLPAIRIEPQVVDEDTTPIGASKLGARPDLPPDFVWPEWKGVGLTFLAQFRISELVAYDVERLLPSEGMLYFFYEVERQPWGYEPTDRGAWQVAFYDGAISALERRPSPFPIDLINSPASHKLNYAIIPTFPDYTLVEHFTGVSLSEEELSRHSNFEIAHSRWKHQLLGHAVEVQSPMRLWCELGVAGRWFSEIQRPDKYLTPEGEQLEAKAVDGWQLLIQLESIGTGGMNALGYTYQVEWGLGGMLYFYVRKEDLAQRRFSNAWLQPQTT